MNSAIKYDNVSRVAQLQDEIERLLSSFKQQLTIDANSPTISDLINKFRAVRKEQLELFIKLCDTDWKP